MLFEVGAAAGVVWHFVEDATKDYLKKTAKEIAGKKIDEAVKAVKRQVVTELPKNGQLVRGLREDHLTALRRVLEKYRADLDRLAVSARRPDDVAFAERLGGWLDERTSLLSGRIDDEAVTESDVRRVLDHMVHPSAVEGFAPVAKARSEAERSALAEIAEVWGRRETLPDRFLVCFHGRDKDGWYEAFALYVRKRLTSDDAFQRIFVAAELVDIKTLLNSLDQRFDEAEQRAAARHRELVDLLARDRGVPRAALQAQLARLGEVDVPEERIPALLDAFVTEFLKLKEDLAKQSNAEPGIVEARKRALAMLEAGDLNGARDAFVAMLVRVRERRQETAREEAALLADKARVDRLRLDYFAAAQAYEEAADLVAFDDHAACAHLMSLAGLLTDQGRDLGDRAVLDRAVEVARRRMLPLVPRERVPLDWALAQNILGNTLSVLGRMESGMARLEEAVEAYRLALEEGTRERAPFDWAMMQQNLGGALTDLGVRDRSTAWLEEAVKAIRLALDVCTRERNPLDWASTQNSLGNTLSVLGELERSTARLEEAVEAYRLALEEWTRERAPFQWAETQQNLGAALSVLGDLDRSTAWLEEAVKAFRLALDVCTRERNPLVWASTQNNLGNTLWTLGRMESGTARLEEAVEAYRLALEEGTRERTPFDWAMTQQNLGAALTVLGARDRSTARLEEAVAAYRLALEEWTQERAPVNWAFAQNNLGNALWMLRRSESGTARLEEAVAALRLALEVRTREHAPFDWAITQNNLGNALSALGEREGKRARLEEAAIAYRLALEEFTEEGAPYERSVAQRQLDRVTALLGKEPTVETER